MYANTSFQNVTLIEVDVHADLQSTPLIIKFQASNGGYEKGWGDIFFHLENAELALALAKAINETLAAFQTPATEEAA